MISQEAFVPSPVTKKPEDHGDVTSTQEVPNHSFPSVSKTAINPTILKQDSFNTSATTPPPIPPVRTKKRKVSELRCGEVRWFYRRNDAEKWVNFNGRDSLALEIKYRSIHDIFLDDGISAHIENNSELLPRDVVVVLEGLYKLNDDQLRIEAIYWKHDFCEVRRGTWFTQDWQPLESPVADSIEQHHLQYFKGQTIPEGLSVFSQKEASSKPQLTELHLDGLEVRWSSVIDIYLSLKRGSILRYIGWGKSQALRRGYHREAEWADEPAEITHLVLVVHGIGQKGYENLIAENAQQVREGVVAAMERCFPEEKSRPMFLPVEWRSALKLDDGITDVLTLPKMSAMRNTLNSTAMDIMYYQSPLYRKEIITGVVHQLNRIYTLFKENNPSFSGPVSIFAHSLGSVIMYDILLHWSPLLLYDKYVTEAINAHLQVCTDESSAATMKAYQDAREMLHEKIDGGIRKVLQTKDEHLKFNVKYLFAVGSPLSVFLVMRGATYYDLLPDKTNVERIFNIFHPYDPVAYRLEPLFAAEYKNIRPVKLFSCNDLRARYSYNDLPLDVYKSYVKKLKNESKGKKAKNEKIDARSGVDDDLDEEDECDSIEDFDARSGCSSPRSLTPPPGDGIEKPVKKGWFSFTSSKKTNAISHEPPVEIAKEAEPEIPLADRILINAIRAPHRIDFQLQPALTDKGYWSVFKSHFSYWTNADLALFIANTLYTKPNFKHLEVA